MRTLVYAALALFVTSCGVFKKKQPAGKDWKPRFQEWNAGDLSHALVLGYTVTSMSDETALTLYPMMVTDSARYFDYETEGTVGTQQIALDMIQQGNVYGDYYRMEDSAAGYLHNAVWLSRRNYKELLEKGSTVMKVEGLTLTYHVAKTTELEIQVDDSTRKVPVVELRTDSGTHYMSFIPDPNFPLIIAQDAGVFTRFAYAITQPETFSDFTPGPGCRLKYRLVEAGLNEYEINLLNTEWSDTVMRFAMSGTYNSESYDYEFAYDVVFRGDALHKPSLEMPVFSAVKGDMIYDKTNWVFMLKSAIDSVMQQPGYLRVPHFAVDPADEAGMYESVEDSLAAAQYFQESYKTKFMLRRWGKINEVSWPVQGANGEEHLLPVVNLLDIQSSDIELQVMNRGKFPLIVYFNDGMLYELSLEFAGYDTED